MSIRSYDERIAALEVENAELRLQCVEWREDWTECQAAIARVRELCASPYDLTNGGNGWVKLDDVLRAFEPNDGASG